ncbi:RNA exonuclease 4 isoform X2 [Planococcus citri]
MKNGNIPKKSKPTIANNLANINHKKATGADNWKAFLESKANAKDASNDEFTLNIGYEDESDTVKKTHVVAMDCEMVGIGEDKKENMLARVSIVNSLGECIYDTFVKPTATITDYRTAVSGVRPCDLVNAEKFPVVQKKVLEILRGKVLVGHAVHNDLIVLNIRHPRHKTRDTSRYKKFYQIGVGTPSLKKLTSHFLNVDIQTGEHNSIQDAQAAMQLYMLCRKEWEADVKQHRHATLRSRSIKKPKKTHKTKKKHRNY